MNSSWCFYVLNLHRQITVAYIYRLEGDVMISNALWDGLIKWINFLWWEHLKVTLFTLLKHAVFVNECLWFEQFSTTQAEIWWPVSRNFQVGPLRGIWSFLRKSVHFFEIMMLKCPPFFVHFLVFRYHPLLCTFYQKASKYDHIILDFCPYKYELINLFSKVNYPVSGTVWQQQKTKKLRHQLYPPCHTTDPLPATCRLLSEGL